MPYITIVYVVTERLDGMGLRTRPQGEGAMPHWSGIAEMAEQLWLFIPELFRPSPARERFRES